MRISYHIKISLAAPLIKDLVPGWLRVKAKPHEVTDMVAVLDADVAVVKSDARSSLKT